MLSVQRIETGKLRANTYLVSAPGGDAVIVDPGDDGSKIEKAIAAVPDLRLHAVLCTHAHFDHFSSAAELCRKFGAPFHLHEADAALLRRANLFRRILDGAGPPVAIPKLDVPIQGGATYRFGSISVRSLHTPGHSPGSVCLEIGEELYCGDFLSRDGLGRTDLPGGDSEQSRRSLAMIRRSYPPDALLRPGHGEPFRLGDPAIQGPGEDGS